MQRDGAAPPGSAELDTDEAVVLGHLGPGDVAGVFALLAERGRPARRQATIVAETDVSWFEIDRLAVDALVTRHPGARAALSAYFRERLLANLLAGLPFFRHLDADERTELVAAFQDRHLHLGEELFFPGYAGDGLWVLLSGEVSLGADVAGDAAADADVTGETRAPDGEPTLEETPAKRRRDPSQESQSGLDVAIRLQPGDYVGVLARATGEPLTLSAVARGPVHVALLPHRVLAPLFLVHKDTAVPVLTRAGMWITDNIFVGHSGLPHPQRALHR